MSKGPGQENSFAASSREMTIPNQMDNKDYGKRSKVTGRKVVIKSSGPDGKVYGARAIMTKENHSFSDYLVAESRENDNITLLPDKIISELKTLIRKGAADLEQMWKDALELVNTAYHVASVRRPQPDQKGAWKQYEELIKYAVQQLASSRGIDGKWRLSNLTFKESVQMDKPQHVGKRRFFVEIPGEAAVEADASSMDELIKQLSNKMRRHGSHLQVDRRNEFGAKLSVWVGNEKRDEILIKEIS